MSFFTYYGKLKEDLLVLVLPSGTVQPGDSVYVYSGQQLQTFAAEAVSTTPHGDRFSFNDNDSSYVIESSNGYTQLSMTVKSADHAQVELTRVYAEPSNGKYHANYPRIWTGALNFHQWATNQPFFILAPQGVGNTKPIVSIWQWSKDAQGTPKTLSYGAFKQTSSKVDNFSFKQNDYYNLVCKVDAATDGLDITMESPSNGSVVQKLIQAAKILPGERHKLSPPKPELTKRQLDCSAPQPTAQLDRITKPLPYPSDLIGALTYSAAYVDHAGYLAKYAVEQYDHLNKAYHEIENRLDKKSEQITGLNGTIAGLTVEAEKLNKKNSGLESENEKLQRELKEVTKKAAEAKKADNARIQELEQKLRDSQNENAVLRKYIAVDKIKDAERDAANRKHDLEDHKIIQSLRDAIKTKDRKIEDLECQLIKKDAEIKTLADGRLVLIQELAEAQDTIITLESQLDVERKENDDLKAKLTALNARVASLVEANKALEDQLLGETKRANDLQEELNTTKAALKSEQDLHNTTKKERDTLKAANTRYRRQIQDAIDKAQRDLAADDAPASDPLKDGTEVTAREVPALS